MKSPKWILSAYVRKIHVRKIRRALFAYKSISWEERQLGSKIETSIIYIFLVYSIIYAFNNISLPSHLHPTYIRHSWQDSFDLFCAKKKILFFYMNKHKSQKLFFLVLFERVLFIFSLHQASYQEVLDDIDFEHNLGFELWVKILFDFHSHNL